MKLLTCAQIAADISHANKERYHMEIHKFRARFFFLKKKTVPNLTIEIGKVRDSENTNGDKKFTT